MTEGSSSTAVLEATATTAGNGELIEAYDSTPVDVDGPTDSTLFGGAEETPSTPTESGNPISSGTVVLQIFHDEQPEIVHQHEVVNDITLIGREDAQRDVFPDLDLTPLAEQGVSVNSVSRQHLRLLRNNGRYFLFIYRGTTGTQVCKDVIDPSRYGQRFEIKVGDRIILGGKVRMKLTTSE